MSIIASPKLVFYNTEKEYFDHYKREYVLEKIETFDGIRVYFSEGRFAHAFFEGRKKGQAHLFSRERAEHIDWIKFTLQNCGTLIYKAWNKTSRQYDHHRRANLFLSNYLVIIEMALTRDLNLKARFITAFPLKPIYNSINKLKKSPVWNKDECLDFLIKVKNNG